jgi:hypothetical protein
VNVLDRCRIRVGEVRSVDGESVSVRTRRLAWDGRALRRTEPVEESARWSVQGSALIAVPSVGDLVTLHWDWVCEVVDAEARRRIEDLEKGRLSAVGLVGA